MLEVPPEGTRPTLSQLALEIAVSQIGVHETKGKANSGPEVDQYLAAAGLDPGFPWCASFVHWCFREAARRLGLVNPCPRTAAALRLWRMAEPICRDSNPRPGLVFVLDHGEGKGHAGFIESVSEDGIITNVSGNTNEAGSREGNAVVRKVGQPEVIHHGTLVGYLDFDRAAQHPPGVA